MILNNVLLIGSNFVVDNPSHVNADMVKYGALWYIISVASFVVTYHSKQDAFMLFDDLFMAANALSLFYSWQTYE